MIIMVAAKICFSVMDTLREKICSNGMLMNNVKWTVLVH